MRLHTRIGRMEVWFNEHKDGLLGIATTIAVALVTSLATISVWELHRHNTPDPSRVIYDVGPKATP
jgi:hypothetical protein